MNVVIAGLGLIGGSLGMALKRRGWRVSFVDPAVSLEEARRAGAANEKLGVAQGELVVLATPVDVALTMKVTADLVTTTCSVMAPFRKKNVVAGHPFAGSEKSGLAAARADLFTGRPWFISRQEPAILKMIDDAGANAVVIDAAEHDRLLALTSHLPQVISTALASLIEQKAIDPVFLGTGLRTLLRLAGSSQEIWQPVIEANRQNIAEATEELIRVMRELGADDFDRARRAFAALPER